MPGVAMPVAEESRPKAVPVHVQATQRLERLEAEITTLGARVSAPATARIVVPVVERRSLPTAQRGADALVRGLTRVPPPLAGEADVEIIIRQPRRSSGATDLGPAPSTAGISQPVAAATTAPAVSLPAVIAADDLEEASVVIVKRPTNRALVADAFQTVTKPAPATTGVKRFLRAFSRG